MAWKFRREKILIHQCDNCKKGFDRPVIDMANYRCPYCYYHYSDKLYDEAKRRYDEKGK